MTCKSRMRQEINATNAAKSEMTTRKRQGYPVIEGFIELELIEVA